MRRSGRGVSGLWWRLVQFGFRLLYNELAFTYDLVSVIVSLGQWRCWQRGVFAFMDPPAPKGGLILELAHGTGNLQLDLQARGYRSLGYDLSLAMGRIAGGKLRRAGLPVRLTRGLAQQLPFPAQAFATVVCTFPTEFIVQEATLREVARVLQPGGKLVIVINGVLTGGHLPARLLEWLYRITGQRPESQPSAVIPTNQSATPEDLFQQVQMTFERCGFRVRLERTACRGSYAQVIIAIRG